MSLILSRRNIARIAFWPLVAALLLAAISASTSAKLNEEHSRTLHATYRQESLLASSYAAQLAQTVQQIDQTTLNLKDDWEAAPNTMSLERKRSRGMFPENGLLYASIIGPTGTILTTSLPSYTMPNLSDLEFFMRQKAECCLGLLISKPEFGRRLGRRVVRFSRRLHNPDGSFGGVAVVSVDPSFLTSFQEEGLPHGDFVSVRLTSGPALSTDSDARPRATRVFYRSDPVFPGASGTEREAGSRFKDGLARFVAWHKLQNYPLVAVAAISERDAFAAYRRLAQNRREMAAFGDLLVLVFALTGTGLSYRLAWRQQREEEVRATYRLATDAANEGFYMIRPVYGRDGAPADFRIEDCNEHGAALYGADRAGLIGHRISRIVPHEFRQDVLALCRRAFEHGIYEDELRVPQHSPIQAAWLYRRVVRSGDGLALTVRDISEAKEHEQALTDLANSDTLTHLPNRRWLAEFLPVALARAANGNRHVALLFIDLDNFKNVNDTLGHDAGDELLQQAAHRLKRAVRASDQVVRLGGDEFTVVLEQVEAVDDVAAIAGTIVAALSEPYTLSVGNSSDLEASVGISLYPRDGNDGDALLKHADIAMYAAKAAGKGRFCFYQSHLSDALLLRLNKERLLRHAVEHDEFTVHYQPRVGVESGRLVSMEALVRWNHPERGLVYPSEFIDLAEDMGLIAPLGELVIDKVCAQLAQWMKEGLNAVPVSVNISPQQLKSGNVSQFVMACMERYDIDASLIEAELTESAVIDNSVTVSRELAGLRACGIKLMIDDFGTGHSSLAQLHRLDVDVLKVDQAFTRSLCDGPEAQVLFRAIVSMAAALDMCVVAEGVETLAQLNALRALACDEVQGHLISRAIEADEMAKLLLRRFLLQPQDREQCGTPGA